MASRKKFPSDRPTDKPMALDDPFETEPPTEAGSTEPPDSEDTDVGIPRGPSTSPELAYYVCPACHANNPEACDVCMGMGIIDRDMMDEWKQKEEP